MRYEESHKSKLCHTSRNIGCKYCTVKRKKKKQTTHTRQKGPQSKQKNPLLEDLQAACKYPLITSLWEMIQRSFLLF